MNVRVTGRGAAFNRLAVASSEPQKTPSMAVIKLSTKRGFSLRCSQDPLRLDTTNWFVAGLDISFKPRFLLRNWSWNVVGVCGTEVKTGI